MNYYYLKISSNFYFVFFCPFYGVFPILYLNKLFTMEKFKVKSITKSNKARWNQFSTSKFENDEEVIDHLKSKKLNFKICGKDVEKTYFFNGNNYVITTIKC